MAFTSLHTIILFLFFILISLPPSSSSKQPFSKIFAFGDSYTDTGNTHSGTGPYSYSYVSNLPYGTTFFHHSTNRYSDGRLVIDFVATNLSLPFLPPYLHRNADFSHGANFAVAGSTALDHSFFVNNNITIAITPQSLQTQLDWFADYLDKSGCRGRLKQCHEKFEDALFWIGEIGANDYAYSFASSVSPNVVQDFVLKNVFKFLEILLSEGAKYIVVQGLPLTGCLPLAMVLSPPDDRDRLGCAATVNNQANNHNLILQSKIEQLRKQYPKAIISYADYFNAHHTIMNKPAVYGFTEPFKACCGSGGDPYNFDIFATCGSPEVTKACSVPSKFVNWDGVHLTEALYKVVADMFLHGGYCHPAFDVLLKHKLQGS
ncbi:putative carboxylesterase [Dioscorea sansibarensis]